MSEAHVSPGANTQPLVDIVVNVPLLQIFTLLFGIFALVLEWPLPLVSFPSLVIQYGRFPLLTLRSKVLPYTATFSCALLSTSSPAL